METCLRSSALGSAGGGLLTGLTGRDDLATARRIIANRDKSHEDSSGGAAAGSWLGDRLDAARITGGLRDRLDAASIHGAQADVQRGAELRTLTTGSWQSVAGC
jgi:hypothetical protein